MTYLKRRFPELQLAHTSLLSGPTPVRALEGIREGLWLKDDSASNALYGGNKTRKLEWSLAQARAKGRKTIVTVGGLGTNHGLATTLFARQLGIETVLVLVDQPIDDHVTTNLAAMRAAGARIVLAHTPRRAYVLAPLALLTARRSWLLPVGGSNAYGVLGFVEAGLELADQVAQGLLPTPDEVVIAVGSGGSAAGLLLGLRIAGLETKVRGVLVNDKTPITEARLKRMAQRSGRTLTSAGAALGDLSLDGLSLDVAQLGEGYGHSTSAGDAATQVFAAHDVQLDPVYTAKAAASLLARQAPGTTVFWHTHNARPIPGV